MSSIKFRSLALSGFVTVLLLTATESAHPQQSTENDAPLPVPHTKGAVQFDCGSVDAGWAKAPEIDLSKDSGSLTKADAKKPLALEFLRSDPGAFITSAPDDLRGELDAFHAVYKFQWDEKRLYGYVALKELKLDSQHPKISERELSSHPYTAAFDDMFHSTAIVEIGAPSWHRWITEMHAHVRPPKANSMTSAFFGRTNNEEEFRELAGQAVACSTETG